LTFDTRVVASYASLVDCKNLVGVWQLELKLIVSEEKQSLFYVLFQEMLTKVSRVIAVNPALLCRCQCFSVKNTCTFSTAKADDSVVEPQLRHKWQILCDIEKTEKKLKLIKNPAKRHCDSKNVNDVFLKVLHTGPGELPSIALELLLRSRRLSYYVNFSAGYARRQVTNNEPKIHPIDSLLLTDISWENIFSGVTRLFQHTLISDTGISEKPILVYGPSGTTNQLHAVLSMMLSGIRFRNLWPKLVITETDDECFSLDDDTLNITMINLPSTSLHSVSSYLLSIPQPAFSGWKGCDEVNWENHCLSALGNERPEHVYDVTKSTNVSKEENGKNNNINGSGANFLNLAIVCCLSTDHKNLLIKSPYFNEQQNVVVHFTRHDLYYSNDYQDWIKHFGESCHHILLNSATKVEPIMLKSDFNRSILHEIQPGLFPFYSKVDHPALYKDVFTKNSKINVVPNKFWLSKNFAEVTIETSRMQKLADYFNLCLSRLEKLKCLAHSYEITFPRIVVLGSGSSHVTEYRASPSFLLQISSECSVLIDCGYDTYTQMHKHFGSEKVRKVLESIKLIYISHKHTDHSAGLPVLLKMMGMCSNTRQLEILCPNYVRQYITRFARHGPHLPTLKQSNITSVESIINEPSQLQYFAQILGSQNFRPILVDHCYPTFGLAVQCQGWKVVYSSDTLPMSKKLIEVGQNADILIHDCLFLEDYHVNKARLKQHSTLSGAVSTARAMNAKILMLTHFQSAYPVVPTNDLKLLESFDGCCVFALDHMEVSQQNVKLFKQAFKDMVFMYEDIINKSYGRKQKNLERHHDEDNEIRSSFNELLNLKK